MNLLFQTRKPRGFHHQPIYFDEEKERLRLKKLEMEGGEKGLGKEESPFAEDIRGQFSTRKAGASRRRRGAQMNALVLMAFVVLLLLMLLLIAL